MTVDEILANGRYTDRRGREWAVLGNAWVLLDPWRWPNKPKRETMTAPEMRLLIERDKHRDVCRGLDSCTSHPVPHVLAGRAHARVFTVVGRHFESRYGATLAEAMDAAYRLAVSSD